MANKCAGSNTARNVTPANWDTGSVTCQQCGRVFTGQRKLTEDRVMVPRHKEA